MTAYRFVEREKGRFHLVTLCRVLGVSPSGYRAWARGPATARATADTALTVVGMITSSGPTVIIRTGPTPDRFP